MLYKNGWQDTFKSVLIPVPVDKIPASSPKSGQIPSHIKKSHTYEKKQI